MAKRKTPLSFPEFGRHLKYFRELRGYTQEELAEMVGMSPNYYGSIERGKQMPTVHYLFRLANALCVSMECLLDSGPPREESGIRDVLIHTIMNQTEAECFILYELDIHIVPLILVARSSRRF